eukprot:13770317-Heterocapsa_arctica.AAC.1
MGPFSSLFSWGSNIDVGLLLRGPARDVPGRSGGLAVGSRSAATSRVAGTRQETLLMPSKEVQGQRMVYVLPL